MAMKKAKPAAKRKAKRPALAKRGSGVARYSDRMMGSAHITKKSAT